jgi:hypothetical protein
LLRRKTTADADAENAEPLISPHSKINPPDPNPSPAYNDPDRNPYFRYQALQKLTNAVTTRSNVYAVWITVGYFEVTPWLDGSGNPLVDEAHPDALQLGAEIGSDTGEIRRHRMFFIMDRTIPVAFERGKNHNVHQSVLVRRIIE